MTDIFLLRHGKSDWEVDVNNFHRPLCNRGKRAAQRIGLWMQQQRIHLDNIWSSPAQRAIETTEKTIKVLGLPVSMIETVDELYDASTANIMDMIDKARQQDGSTLIVGHNPSIEMALNLLVPEQLALEADDKVVPTATLAHIKFDEEGKADLKQLIRPKTLPKHFPVETSEGVIFAERPAYYFQQSGVVPYRYYQEQWQVLLVTKSHKATWSLPKGIVEPGLSAIESAAKEAMEEAGISGEVMTDLLGCYQHKKWGGICDIALYPMQVHGLLDDAAWESNKRNRRWFSFSDAIAQVEDDDIKQILMKLATQLGAV